MACISFSCYCVIYGIERFINGKINELYNVKGTWHGRVYFNLFILSIDLEILSVILSTWFVQDIFLIIVKPKKIIFSTDFIHH